MITMILERQWFRVLIILKNRHQTMVLRSHMINAKHYVGKNNTKKDYSINDKINKCEYARDLGIYIDDKLSFDYHLNLIIKKTSSNISYSEDI